MSKKTLKYNPDSLHFETSDKGCKGKIFRFIQFFFGGLFFVIIMLIIYINNFETYKAKRLEEKNKALVEKYELLNKELVQLESNLQEIAVKDDKVYRVVLGKMPLGEDLRNAGIGGTDRYEEFEKYQNYELLKKTTKNLEVLINKLKVQKKSFTEVSKEAQNHQLMLSGKPSIQPVSVKDFVRISSSYGYRIDPVYGGRRMHRGLDFASPINTNIYATGDGEVYIAGYNKHGYGNEIIIKHHGGYMTKYAHLNKILVKRGDKIKRGQVIGLLGNTGKSTGPHLHYEVIFNGRNDNPAKYYFNNLSVEEFEQIVKFSQGN
jgi:murein DD-endopeptidase MepM/ murein hydrolase activator NlpD